MKRLILLLCPLLIGAGSQGQMLTQSSDGQSAIPIPLNGLGVSFDIGKIDATVGVNNYGRVLNSKTYKFKDNFLMGANLSVKTANGLGQLFSSGDIVPEGNLLAYSGYSFSNMAAIAHGLGSPHDLDEQKKKELARLEQRYKAQVQYTILKQRRKITDVVLRDRMMSHLLRAVQGCNSADEVDEVTDSADIDPAKNTPSEALKDFKQAVKAVSAGDHFPARGHQGPGIYALQWVHFGQSFSRHLIPGWQYWSRGQFAGSRLLAGRYLLIHQWR